MAKSKEFNYDDYKGKTLTDVQMRELFRFAHRANDRLLRLEKAGYQNSPAYGKVEALNYKSATGAFTGGSKPRFKEKKTYSYHEAQALAKQLDLFFKAKTSSVSGVKQAYKAAYKNYKKTTNFKGSLQDYMNLWESEVYREFQKLHGSDFTAQVVNKIIDTSAVVDFMQNNMASSNVEIVSDYSDLFN